MDPDHPERHGVQQITDEFLPLFNRASIDLMVSGHTHRYELIQPTEEKLRVPMIVDAPEKPFDAPPSAGDILFPVIVNGPGTVVQRGFRIARLGGRLCPRVLQGISTIVFGEPEFPKEIFSADGRIIWCRSAGMITFAVGIAGRLYRCSRKAEFRPIRETGGEESPGNAERRAS